jgi:hypothetical protein
MVNFERKIIKAIPKIKNEYLKGWVKTVHDSIYVELDNINIFYENNCSWADITIRWGREDDTFSFHHNVTIAVYPRHLKHIAGYILGVMQYQEDQEVE